MKTINAGYEIVTPISEGGIKELQYIERIGRVCYKSEDKIFAKKSRKALTNPFSYAIL